MPQDNPELLDRQKRIDYVQPVEKAVVVGCGGIGSWVAIFLAMSGTKQLILVDPDIVEESNRSRVVFNIKDVGRTKVHALAEYIYERRYGCELFTYPMKIEEVPEEARDIFAGSMVFDCCDSITPLPEWLPKTAIKSGYNGTHATIHLNPDLSKVFSTGEPIIYAITPSYAPTPAFIGAMTALYATMPELHAKEEHVTRISLPRLFRSLFRVKQDE